MAWSVKRLCTKREQTAQANGRPRVFTVAPPEFRPGPADWFRRALLGSARLPPNAPLARNCPMPMRRCLILLAAIAAVTVPHGAAAQDATLALTILDRGGTRVTTAVDGNTVTLRAALDRPARQAAPVTFERDGTAGPLARCTIARGATQCDSPPLATLGWYWSADGAPRSLHTLHARTRDLRAGATLEIAPRPVVLVHGLLSSATTWSAYTRAADLPSHQPPH